MRLKCRGCGVVIAMKDRGVMPGTMIRVTCPKCGQAHTTAIPGHADTDEALRRMREVSDLLHKMGVGAP